MKVYLAGKIGHTDWRHDIFDLRGSWEDYPQEEEFRYAGPFFISCDHGCYHGANSHGVGANADAFFEGQPALQYPDVDKMAGCGCGEDPFKAAAENRRRTVAARCLRWIDDADSVFCWIESLDCYGTLVEIGYAMALGKPIFIGVKSDLEHDDLWFAMQLGAEARQYSNHQIAWKNFKKWVRRHGRR